MPDVADTRGAVKRLGKDGFVYLGRDDTRHHMNNEWITSPYDGGRAYLVPTNQLSSGEVARLSMTPLGGRVYRDSERTPGVRRTRLGKDGIVYDVSPGQTAVIDSDGGYVELIDEKHLTPLEVILIEGSAVGTRLKYNSMTGEIEDPSSPVSETPPAAAPQEPQVTVHWIIGGQLGPLFTKEDTVELVLTDIRNADDVRAAASAWLTSFTNAVSGIINELNEKEGG